MMNEKESILCIDDEEMIRITIGDFLEDCGYTVYLAKDGEEGLMIFREKSPDLVLVDLRMPKINGFQVLSAVAKESPLTPVIVISGTGVLRDAIEALRLGAWNYITKPIEDMTFLEHSVKETLEKSRLQKENIAYRENLENMVLERTAALEEANQHLQQAQKMEAIGTLAGGIAHDFNNILSAILGYTELAMMKLEPEHEIREDLDEVRIAGRRAKDLVSQILAFSRRGDQSLTPLIVHPIVKEALRLLRSSIPTTIEISQAIHKCGTVRADATQVHQVIMNLCTNAYHAMEQEKGVMEVILEDVTLDAEDCRGMEIGAGLYVHLCIKDSGCGMTPSLVHKIFDPYFTTKEQGTGTGMGLSVVHGIVQQHRGGIRVESAPGAGSTFHVYLPREKGPSRVATESIESLPSGTEHILFVDDEVPIAEMGRQMLEKLGYRVTAVSESGEALEIFREGPHKFDLVITDMTMPGMTGKRLARKLTEIRNDIPVILCTGHSNRISSDSAKALGIRAFAMKPMEVKELAGIVRKVLDSDSG